MRFIVLAALISLAALAHRVLADLENQQRGGEGGVFTSAPDHLQLVVPRTWHASDQASYPGVLLWLEHGPSSAPPLPEAHIVLTADPFTRQVYCSWVSSIPAAVRQKSQCGAEVVEVCPTNHDSLPAKFACALRLKLSAQHMCLGQVLAGPKENEVAGMETVFFDYTDHDGKRFLRQAVAVTEDRVVSLLLSTTAAADARTYYTRAFEQALRTLAPWNEEATAPLDAGVVLGPPGDAGLLVDAAVGTTAPTTLTSAPPSKIHPVGPCAQ